MYHMRYFLRSKWGKASTREETHSLLMGVQGQVQGRWHTWQVWSIVGCKKILSTRTQWLWGDLCSYKKDEHHPISSSDDSIVWLECPSNGCEERLPQWIFGTRGLHISYIVCKDKKTLYDMK